MKQTLIKLSDTHYIVVDDSEIKEGDWVLTKENTVHQIDYVDAYTKINNWSKITHSTIPLESMNHGNYSSSVYLDIEKLSLQEVKELIGEVDVDKKMISPYPMDTQNDVDWCNGYQRGYNQALEDNKDKKYTEEDIDKAYWAGMQFVGEDKGSFGEFIQSLQPKTEWEVEFIDGKLKLK